MTRKLRRWHHDGDIDPLGGLVNLFDLWIVVVVGLTLALLRAQALPSHELADSEAASSGAEPSPQELVKLPRYRKTTSTLTGKGEKLGTAYRLESGEVVYVPE